MKVKERFLFIKVIITCLTMLLCTDLSAQENIKEVSGRVTDAVTGEPLIGVTVREENLNNGTITDLNGHYVLTNLKSGAILVFSYVGYQTQRRTVDSKTIDIKLSEMQKVLNEVIVVGYGVQRKSVVTAAISGVRAGDLANVTPTRIDNVLRGLVSGVSITQASGQPGASSKVRVRGSGTINNSDPLYVVDGMPINGGIDYLNPTDIESVEVLKDAASAAIYGTRGANGVILVTTKKGRSGKATINYDFSYGWQNPWKKLGVLNATQYATLMNEMSLNDGGGVLYNNPTSYGKGTDWQDAVFNKNAGIEQHQLSVSGGSNKGNYYLSLGYLNQDGIVGGNFNRSNYNRYTLRFNNNYDLFDESASRDFFRKMTISTNLSYSRIESRSISDNTEYGSPLGSAIQLSPILPIYAKDPNATLATYPTAITDKNGKVYTIPGSDYNELTNPLAALTLPGDLGNSDKIVANLWAELELYKNLKFKSSYGVDLAFWGDDGYTPIYYLGKTNYAVTSSVWSTMNRGFTWQVENTLTYTNTIGKHNFTVLLGQSAEKDRYRYLSGTSYNMINESWQYANLDATTEGAQLRRASGAMYPYHALASYFGRVNYNYDERYMLEASIRKDGSSNFGPNHKWGTFPSLSAGWNLTNEKFMKNRPAFLDYAKLRASWGKNGNESIASFRYTSMENFGNNYILGTESNLIIAPGAKPNGYANKDIKWEESEQTDVGLDLVLFNNSFTFTTDWFDKRTNGMLMSMSLPGYIGDTAPIGNVGDMQNTGLEFDASYHFNVNDFKFTIGGNASYIKNKLIKLGTINGWANYDYVQNVGTITRAANGEPFPYFYGYKTAGIFQTWAQINKYVNSKGQLLEPNARPGDVIFVDVNGDGVINDADRTKIGKGMPDWTYGFNLSIQWKDFDLYGLFQGTIGNDIFDASKRTDLSVVNLPSWMLERWTGPGTSNRLPRLTMSDPNGDWQSSDLYVHDGSYLRLRDLELGYSLPKSIVSKAFIQKLRFYIKGENLLTVTGYKGFDPEISSGGTSLGVDRGVYPQSRTIYLGANIVF